MLREKIMKRTNKSGFTLIELLTVVLIISILAAVALPQYSAAVEKSRSAEALSLSNAVANAVKRYRFQKDAWPTNFNQLDIEVPYQSATSDYGGKYFVLTTSSATNTYTIDAARRGLAAAETYTIRTVLTDDSNTDTISAVRSCVYSQSGGQSNCNTITGGHNSNF